MKIEELNNETSKMSLKMNLGTKKVIRNQREELTINIAKDNREVT